MKKTMALLLAMMMFMAAPALAAEDVTANGVVRSGNVEQLTAPFSGVLLPFDWAYGDRVEADEVLFVMQTQKVYAPADGTMQAVFAQEGDLCEDVQMLYGCIGTMTRATERWHRRMEKRVLDEASVVVAVSPLVQQEFQNMTQTPVELITNGFDECDFEQGAPDQSGLSHPGPDQATNIDPDQKSRLAAGGPDKDFVITHTGLFAADGNPTTLWKVLAAKCTKDEEFRKHLRIRFVGKTDDAILEAVREEGLDGHLTDMGYQPHAVAIREQRTASLLILPLRKEPEYRAVLPGKLFEYLASWRPVLGIGQPDGAMSMILNTTKTGVVLNWEDEASITRFIDLCWKNHLKGELTVDDADISQFTRRNLTHRMAELFDRLTRSKG